MGRRASKWLKQVDPYFGFLREHGFTRVTTDGSSFWSLWVRYASPHAAVQVAKRSEFTRVEVALIRLVDGEVPPYPISITAAPVNHALLDTVLEARDEALLRDAARMGGLGAAQVERQLSFWATTLREVAPECLEGDLSAVDEAEAVVRRRVAEQPQQLTTWIPDDAPPTAEAEELEEMKGHVPEAVAVEVRRYRRPKR